MSHRKRNHLAFSAAVTFAAVALISPSALADAAWNFGVPRNNPGQTNTSPDELAAGSGITVEGNRVTNSSACTVGGSWRGKTGRLYLLTAGHCAKGGSRDEVFDPGSFRRAKYGKYAWSMYGRGGDVAGYRVVDRRVLARPAVYLGNDSSQMVKHWHGARNPSAGQSVCVSGSVSFVSCNYRVARTNATQRMGDRTVGNLTIASRLGDCVLDHGDSGAPVYVRDRSNDAYFAGVLSGGTEKYGRCYIAFTPPSAIHAQFGGSFNLTWEGPR